MPGPFLKILVKSYKTTTATRTSAQRGQHCPTKIEVRDAEVFHHKVVCTTRLGPVPVESTD